MPPEAGYRYIGRPTQLITAIASRGTKLRGRRVGMIETSTALGACLLVLTVAVVLDRRPYRPGKRNYIPTMIIALAAALVFDASRGGGSPRPKAVVEPCRQASRASRHPRLPMVGYGSTV